MVTRTKIISTSGVYQILSLVNGKRYIGSAVNLRKRINGHKSKLRHKAHKNTFLQRHVNKYGLKDLQFSILELCPRDQVLERELYWFNTLDTDFNILSDPNSSFGFKHSLSSIQKMKDWRQSEEGRKWKEKYSGENCPAKRLDVRIKVSENSGSHKIEVREKIRKSVTNYVNSPQGQQWLDTHMRGKNNPMKKRKMKRTKFYKP